MATRPDDAEVAWGNVLDQHHGKPLSEAFVKALMRPLAALGQAAQGMMDANDLDVAKGAHLDAVGSIVGIGRDIPSGVFLSYFGFDTQPAATGFGRSRMRLDGDALSVSYTMPDIEYRGLIRAKIALNNGHGTSPEIRDALIQAFNTPRVSVRDQPGVPATARAWIGRLASEAEVLSNVIPRLLPRLAGVKLEFLFYDPEKVFGFKGQAGTSGFGVGIMLRTAQTPVATF